MPLTADIQRAFRDGGTKIVISRGLRKLVRPAFKIGTLIFIEADLTQPLEKQKPVTGIIPHEATIDDAHLFEDQALFIKRFNEGHRCFMGIEEKTGKLANYRWVNSSAALVPELDRYLILRPGEVYIYDLNTMAEFRRRGIDAYTRYYTYNFLRETGYKKVIAYIHGDNPASLKASRHLLKPVGRLSYIQFRGFPPIMIGGRGPQFPELRRV